MAVDAKQNVAKEAPAEGAQSVAERIHGENVSPPRAVQVREIVWAAAGWSKQKAEDQDDTMGAYQLRVALISPKGKEVVIQEMGKPTNAIPTFQRQLIKVCLAAYNTHGTDKGSMFLDTLALNLSGEDAKFMQRLMSEGWLIDAQYGAKRRVYTSVADLMAVLSALTAVRNSTLKQYPAPVDNKPGKAAVTPVEEVTVVL